MEGIFNFIADLFVGEGLIIAVGCYVIAEIIKTSDLCPKKFIPLIGGALGIILGCIIPGLFSGRDVVSSGVLGLALGWAATGGYEAFKTMKGGK